MKKRRKNKMETKNRRGFVDVVKEIDDEKERKTKKETGVAEKVDVGLSVKKRRKKDNGKEE